MDGNHTFRLVSRRKFLLGLAGLPFLGALSQPAAEAVVPFQPFSFAYLTDVHLVNGLPDSYKLTQESQLFLQEVVKQLNGAKVDFVVFGGDQVEGVGKEQVNWQLFLDIVQGLNPPWSFVLGEADLIGETVHKMRTFGPDWKGRGIETEHPYWSLNPVPDVHIVGLDSSIPNTTAGGINEEQLTWLKEDLQKNKKYFTIIFCHHPLLPPPPFDGGPPWERYVIPDGASVREVIAPFSQVRLVISGHVHVNKVQKEADVWHVSSSSLDVYPCQFKIFKVDATSITMETWQVPFPALVKKGRKTLDESNLAFDYNRQHPDQLAVLNEGLPVDRDAILPLAPGKPIQPLKKKGPAPGTDDKKDKDKDKDKDKGKEAPAKKDKKDKDEKKDKDNKKDKGDKDKGDKKKKSDKKDKEPEKNPAPKQVEAPPAEETPETPEDKKVPDQPKEAPPAEDNTQVESAPAPAPAGD